MGLLVAHRHAQLVDRTAELAMPDVGRVTEATRRVCRVAEAAIAKATSMCNQVESHVISLATQAEVITLRAISGMAR